MNEWKKRIGNDIPIEIAVTRNGEAEDLSSLGSLSVILKSFKGTVVPFEYFVQRNVIKGVFYGKDQYETGKYILEVVENGGEPEMASLDADIVTLVDRTSKEDEGNGNSVDVCFNICPRGVSLSATVTVSKNGLSAYELAVLKGFSGTVEEWLESLIGPKGERGENLHFEDLTPEEKEEIRGQRGYQGEVGPKGDTGDGLHVDGTYSSYNAFIAAHPEGTKEEVYIVGGNIFTWSETESIWVNGGRVQGPQGQTGQDGKPGEPLKYKDLTELDKEDLRKPLEDIVDAARENASNSAYQALLAKRSSDEAKDIANASMAAIDSINASIQRIVEMGGQGVEDILASLDVMNEIANIKSSLALLGPLYPHEIAEDDWDRMTNAQQQLMKDTFATLYIVEGSSERSGGYIFIDGVLTMSPNCSYGEDGTLTLADCSFENGILTLNQ